jgi:uncharacterized lipoprotein YehR (DUF1307 family)
MKKIVLYMIVFLSLTACGKEEKEDLTYRFNENGCDTGEQKSASKDEYCSKLRDDSLNKFCAKSLREKEFNTRGCS